MSLQNSQHVPLYTKIIVFILAFFIQVTVRAWDVDLTRRQKDLSKGMGPGVVTETMKPKDIVNSFMDSFGPTQDVVIMNTDKGFVPETVKLKKGQNYRFHIVNVNGENKNVSFILDAFSEHHGTYFGSPKEFQVSPKQEGIFSFQCPETSKQGRIIVINEDRKPASE